MEEQFSDSLHYVEPRYFVLDNVYLKQTSWAAEDPDTGANISSERVPNWKALSDKFIDQIRHIPFFYYVGWDIILQEDDVVVVEGNNFPQVRMHQIFRPLLAELRTRRFFAHYGIK